MKKILFAAFLAIATVGVSQNSTPRFDTYPKDNTGRNLTLMVSTPTLAATDSIAPRASITYIKPATLAGAKTITANIKKSRLMDEVIFIFTSDGTGRVVTFSTGFVVYGTLTLVASKQATISFVFDGTNYVELSRTIQQ